MRLIRRAVLFLIFVDTLSILALCQQPAALSTVLGVVKLEDTGAPATGSMVSLRRTNIAPPSIPASGEYVIRDQSRQGDLNATIDRSGTFRMDDVPPGDYELMTYKPGYFDPDAIAANGFKHEVHVAAGETKKIDVHLERGGTIEGQVRFDNGVPAHTGRQVADEVAVGVEIETSGRLSPFGGAAHTDAEGRYSIGGLPAGTYIVSAGMPGKMVAVKGGELGSGGRIVFAPRGVRASNAERIEVHPPDTVSGVDIVIQTRALHSISGKVVDQNGTPVTVGLVRLYPTGESALPQPSPMRSSPLGINGEFSFDDLPNDDYTIKYKSYPEYEPIGVTADHSGVRIRVHKAPYAPATEQVRISGQDSRNVVLRVRPAD